jgi:hypothetical protein
MDPSANAGWLRPDGDLIVPLQFSGFGPPLQLSVVSIERRWTCGLVKIDRSWPGAQSFEIRREER